MTIAVHHVCFAYGASTVLSDINARFEAGRFYGIIGPNGCGKSTLMDLLIGFKKPATGTIFYDRSSLSGMSRYAVARAIALAPQRFVINFPFPVREIIMMGRYPHIPRFSRPSAGDEAMVASIMKQTDTTRFSHRFVTDLSGGEQQRVIFARALAQDTPVLLLDEATANLDINHALSLLSLCKKRVTDENKTVVSVFHDLNLAALFCDWLFFMDQGRVISQGPVADVLTAETIKTVFGVHARVFFDADIRAMHVVIGAPHDA